MNIYNEVVSAATQTCYACPAQWEGTLKDGRAFYFRYRSGEASLGIGKTRDQAITDPGAWRTHGDGLDGFMEEDEFHDVFGLLYHQHEDMNPWVVTAVQAFPNGEVNSEVWGTFLTKSEADSWIDKNRPALDFVGGLIQVKELRPVDGPTTILP